MRYAFRRAVSATALAVICSTSATLRADPTPDEQAAARVLFNDAKKLVGQQQYPQSHAPHHVHSIHRSD